MSRSSWARRALLTLYVTVAGTVSAAAQQSPSVRGLVSGYGSVGYSARPSADLENDFTSNLATVLLYQVGDDILFEGELELELEGGGTEAHLEHAQLHYLGFEHVRVTAGMFHLPFGIWMHANWVNRMPTPPLLYEDSHGAPPGEALLPIPFDVGVKASADFRLGDGWRSSATVWVSQGPASGIATHAHGEETHDATDAHEPASNAPPLGYGANFEDNNSDKMVGVRLRAVSMGGLTLQGSGFRAAYDDAGDLGVYGANASLIWAPRAGRDPLFDFRAERIFLRQEYLHHAEVETVDYGGHYLQISRRLAAFEPVVRWSHLPRAVAGHGPVVERRRQVAVGLNYWFSASVPLKLAYHFELDGSDGLFIEWAAGF